MSRYSIVGGGFVDLVASWICCGYLLWRRARTGHIGVQSASEWMFICYVVEGVSFYRFDPKV